MRLIDQQIDSEQKLNPAFNASKMADRMRIDPSLFSRWRGGGQGSVNRETLTSMLVGYSDDPLERAQLLAAYLEDQKHGPGAELIEIRILGEPIKIKEQAADYGADEFSCIAQAARESTLDKKTLAAMDKIIRGLEGNPNLRRVLLSLAKMAL